MIHLVGKLRRFYLVYFRKGYIKRQLALRKGECHQCARCCSFGFVCPMLTRQRLCRIYNNFRLKMCNTFPIDQRDIDEVALCGGTCGYHFEKGPLYYSPSYSIQANFSKRGLQKGKEEIGNAKLIGGHINYDDNHDEISNFITSRGTFSYNERTDEFKSKLQIR